MSYIRFVLGAIGLSLCFVMAACDGFFDYTVVNNTNREVLVWAMTKTCDEITGKKGDYYHTQIVLAGETVNYHETYGGGADDPSCLQVATIDRHLIASVDVTDKAPGRLVVEEPITSGPFVPPENDLPAPSLATSVCEFLNDLVRLVIIPVAILFALFAIPTVLVLLLFKLGSAVYRRARW